MKIKVLPILVPTVAVLCFAMPFAIGDLSNTMLLLAFPISQIASGLAALSELGGIFSGLALALYCTICLTPAFFAFRKITVPNRKWENIALIALSLIAFTAIYLMININGILIAELAGTDGIAKIKAILGCAVWSGIACYLTLYVIRRFREKEQDSALKNIKIMIYLIAAAFTAVPSLAIAGCLLNPAASLDIIRVAPYIIYLIICFDAVRLIDALLEDLHSEKSVFLAQTLSKFCIAAICTTVLCSVACNLLQIILINIIPNISIMFDVPVFGIVFAAAALLLSRLITDNKQLNDDNELFI